MLCDKNIWWSLLNCIFINLKSTFPCFSPSLLGQSSQTVSSSPSTESLSGGRGQSTASPPQPLSRGSDVSTSSPPLSATKKESFFSITRSRSHSKTMSRGRETVRIFLFSFSQFHLLILFVFLTFWDFVCVTGGGPGGAGVVPAGPD